MQIAARHEAGYDTADPRLGALYVSIFRGINLVEENSSTYK
jgi:hypothetical protein